MITYKVWVLDDSYTKTEYLEQWLRLKYRIALNGPEAATLLLPANYGKLASIALMDRLRIVRGDSIVWAGLLESEGWDLDETAPANDSAEIQAVSAADYLRWRTVPRPAGQDFDVVTDHADDIARGLVDRHMGPSAAAARQIADVTVEADAHAATSISVPLVGGVLLDHLVELANGNAFYWRFVPDADGVEFRAATPLWGLDRTKGNGVNDELVLTLDRNNVRTMRYWHDLGVHANYIYVAGQGEGKDQAITEREDAGAVTAYKRRERWLQATGATTTDERNAAGDTELARRTPYETMEVEVQPGILTPSNLGDKLTVFARRYGRTLEFTAIINAITFEVGASGVEYATPELVAA